MSRFQFANRQPSPLKRVTEEFSAMIKERGSDFVSNEQTRQMIGLENLSESGVADLEHHVEGLMGNIREAFHGIGIEGLNDSQLQAGALAAMAAGAPSDYAQKGYTNIQAVGMEGITVVDAAVVGAFGQMDYRMQATASLEAFSEQELRSHIPYSIAFNVQASRQDAFAEAFYPTIVVTPDQAGLDITVRRTQVYNEVRHGTSGKAIDFNKKNLVDAVRDASILANESTRVIPVVQEDDSNIGHFVDRALVGSTIRRIENVDIKTAPLAMGQEVDLIGISQSPGLIGAGIMDMTDALDARLHLEKLYLKVGGKAVRFPVERLPRTQFVKSVEGNYREMNLQFSTNDLVLTADTRAVDNSEVGELAAIKDNRYTVKLNVSINGEVNVELGNLKIFSSPVKVVMIHDIDGNAISLTKGAGKAIVDSLGTIEAVGYDLFASRSNANRRTRGLILDNTEITERHTIPLGSPISVPAPLNTNRDAADLTSLINAARIRNTNNAVTALLNYAETLKNYVTSSYLKGPVPEIEGVGRYLVKPFYEESTIDLSEIVNSISSAERAEDIAATLVNAIRDVAYRMHRDSGYQVALDAMTGGLADMPELLIGTDSVLMQHLMVSGDNRTAGIGFDYTIVGSPDIRMYDKIVLTFSRKKTAGTPDPLSFGNMAWIPELTSSVTVNRNGATTKESMVQPRSRHINNLPIMAVINVKGLRQILTSKVKAAWTAGEHTAVTEKSAEAAGEKSNVDE